MPRKGHLKPRNNGKHPGGRTPKWNPQYPEIAKRFALLGMKDVEMAESMGISESTLYKWKIDYPEFSEAIKSGKEGADGLVVAAAFNSAIGFDYTETEEHYSDKDGTRRVTKHKHEAPNVAAQRFWLKNRRPNEWRDRREYVAQVEQTTRVISGEPVSEEDWEAENCEEDVGEE